AARLGFLLSAQVLPGAQYNSVELSPIENGSRYLMNLALRCKFDVQFCFMREYDSRSGGDMTRQDFVREMKESLAEQKNKADQNQREKLHDADVINKQGLKQWDDLLREVKALSQEIGITFWPLEGHSFRLKNGASELDVRLDEAISYTGVAQGLFEPVVVGSELRYSLQEKRSPIVQFKALLERTGQTFNVEEIAEYLARIVAGNP